MLNRSFTVVVLPPKGWVRERMLLNLGVLPFGRSKLREEVAAGNFPAPKRFGPRNVAYDAEAVHRWIDDQRAAS